LEREETLRRFEPLRKKLGTYKPVVLTTAEQAEVQREEATVARISGQSIEDVVGQSSKVRVDLQQAVGHLIGTIDSQRVNLDDVRHTKIQLQEKLENARNVRLAADAIEVARQKGEERISGIKEQHTRLMEELKNDINSTMTEWGRQDTAREQQFAREDAVTLAAQKAEEESLEYELSRKRRAAADMHVITKRGTERLWASRAEEANAIFDAREESLNAASDDVKSLTEQISVLTEKLSTQPNEVRSATISRITKEEEKASILRTKQREAAKMITQREIETAQGQVQKQQTLIASLEEKIERAVDTNNKLTSQAIPVSKAG